jgi:phosphoglycolate phosphatase-like HAD superfamily hydrolase
MTSPDQQHSAPIPRQLVLFDIDATLVTTSGIGITAMRDAGRSVGKSVELADATKQTEAAE